MFVGLVLILFSFSVFILTQTPEKELFEKKIIKVPVFNEKEIELKFPENYSVKEENNKRKITLNKPEKDLVINIHNPYPTLELLKWRDTSFLISLMEVYPEEPELIIDGNKIIYSNSWFDEVFYEVENGFEYEVILKVRPNKNHITFDVNSENLKFNFQAPLNEIPTNDGFDCNATDCLDENGFVVIHRPEKIVGSYAVYHESKAHNEYKTGKAFSIYKPHIIDANGNQEWCEIDYDESKTEITIECPRAFIRNAVYPLTIDPTFGYDTEGGSNISFSAGFAVGNIFGFYSADGTETITELHAWLFDEFATGTFKMALYDLASALTLGDRYFAADQGSMSIADTTPRDWNILGLSHSLVNGNDYYVAYGEQSMATNIMYDSESAGDNIQVSSGTLLSTFNKAGANNRKYSIYAVFTSGPPETTCDDFVFDLNWFISDECFFVDENISIGSGLLSIDCGGVLGLDNAFVSTSYPYFNYEFCVTEANPVRRKNGGDIILTPN